MIFFQIFKSYVGKEGIPHKPREIRKKSLYLKRGRIVLWAPKRWKVFYEQEVIVKSKGTKRTYVTNHVSCYKSDKYGINRSPISLSGPENTIGGIFFGTLARAFYPQIAEQAAEITIGSSSGSGEVVHVIKNGDTLGKIAAQYIGNAGNYKAIATYNVIKNPSAIRIGQRIRIPKRLQEKK